MQLLSFCMSSAYHVSSVSPFISEFHAFPNAQSSNRNSFFLLNQVTLESWHGFRSSWPATSRKYLAVEQRTAQIWKWGKHRVHHGWLVLLNAKFGQVLWSRNQLRFMYSYSLWCMGPYGDGATTLSQIHPPSFRAPIGLMLFFSKTIDVRKKQLDIILM